MSTFIILIFLLIFFIYILRKRENFQNYECPNSIVRLSDKVLVYYNSNNTSNNIKNIIGINPIIFESLEEYKKYINYQNERGMNCPILNVNHTNKILEIEDTIKNKILYIPNEFRKKFIKKNVI